MMGGSDARRRADTSSALSPVKFKASRRVGRIEDGAAPPPMRKGGELQETPPPFDDNGVRLFIGVVGFPFPVPIAPARGLTMAGKRLLGLRSATCPSRGVFTLHSSRQFARPGYREIHPGEAAEVRYWIVEVAAVGERDVWGYTDD